MSACTVAPLTNGAPPEVALPAERGEQKPMTMDLEYATASSKAVMRLDLASDDMVVEMTRRPPRRDSVVRTETVQLEPATAQGRRPADQIAKADSASSRRDAAASEDSLLEKARRIVDSAVHASGRLGAKDTASGGARTVLPDSVTTQVVAEIRKAQESFYKGRYQEAADHASRSIAIHPTPEGCALAGSICWTRKDKEGARRYWLQARALDPDFPGLSAVLDSQEVSP